MKNIDSVMEKLIAFRDERDWEQFHNSKDLALAISIEAAELLEVFLWKKNEEFSKEKLEEELADVLSYCFLLAHKHDLDISSIIEKKIASNEKNTQLQKPKAPPENMMSYEQCVSYYD